jgi:hypothetical protein
LLVHFPDLGVLNGEKNETVGVFFEDGFVFTVRLSISLLLLQKRSETELVGLDVIEVGGDKDFGLGVNVRGAVLRKGFHWKREVRRCSVKVVKKQDTDYIEL